MWAIGSCQNALPGIAIPFISRSVIDAGRGGKLGRASNVADAKNVASTGNAIAGNFQWMFSGFYENPAQNPVVVGEESSVVADKNLTPCEEDRGQIAASRISLSDQTDDTKKLIGAIYRRYATSAGGKYDFLRLHNALHRLGADDPVAPVLESFRRAITKDTGSWLVIKLSRAGRRRTAFKVLEWLSDRKRGIHANAYNSLITGLMKDGDEADAIAIFERMKHDRVAPTLYTYTAVMRALSHVQGWESAHRMFSELVVHGSLKPDVAMYNTMLAAYGRGHKLERVLQTWERMQKEGCVENVGTYCLLVSTFVQTNQADLALDAYARMNSQGLKATDGIYRGLVCVCATQGRWLVALTFFKEMLESGCKPTIVTYNVLMRALGKAGKWEIVLDLLPRMKASGVAPDFYTVNAVLNGLIAAREFDRAMLFFHSVKSSGMKLDREVYNVILVACQKSKNWEAALSLVQEMEQTGIAPNEVTFGPLLVACENAKQVEVALRLYEHMKQRRCVPNTHVVASLIRACGKELMWQQARNIYRDFRKAGQKPNVYVYNALIDAYCRSQKYHLAKKVDRRMIEEGCQRNNVTNLLRDKYYKRTPSVTDY
ncbi:pentatricopeptide repeat-containing protein At3g29290 isoform X1 [Selaginella moellendorffii]|uniref:pentatricopeptide repeat-containing protein At3g29290 isoform X1 n=1 Tax=Selaginella moellendorffii TaxID=88036 RepID=UPI000D1CCD3A|nr:pentatricopeptide repeat-containing protein At3g29290 isoform X1 [Selaginella moellendorffii]|eukprot:XP_024531808.1 pentatricopeptide repeat-containing protein At3g29290 isoform X1 [Selaginella moellendorffii]